MGLIWDLLGDKLSTDSWGFSPHAPTPHAQWVGISSACSSASKYLGLRHYRPWHSLTSTCDIGPDLNRAGKNGHWVSVKEILSSVPQAPVSGCTTACWYLSCRQEQKDCFVTAVVRSVSPDKPMHGRVKGGSDFNLRSKLPRFPGFMSGP